MTARFAVDAGGSRTKVRVALPAGPDHVLELASVNPHATGEKADRTLRELFAAVNELTAGHPVVGWLASAAIEPERPTAELDRVRAAATAAGLAATMVVSNDLVPLLWCTPVRPGVGVVAVCGTGTGFLGADDHGNVGRAGGCEYLGSDEGGAVDLGLSALRAVVRALDGRGPDTALVAGLTESTGRPPADLARAIAAEPFPKQRLAELAPVVCAAWAAGDPVAATIVDGALTELVTGVRAVCARLTLPDRFGVAAAGGVLTANPALYQAFAHRLRTGLGVADVVLVGDPAGAALAALRTVGDRVPDHVGGRHAWALTTGP
jgi:N-acetylglucosamine kinase-like BadF-type ATPase